MRVEHAGRAVCRLATRGAIIACCFVDIAFGLAAALTSPRIRRQKIVDLQFAAANPCGPLLRHGLQGAERIVSIEAFANSTTF